MTSSCGSCKNVSELWGDIGHSFKSICVDITKPDIKKKKKNGFLASFVL